MNAKPREPATSNDLDADLSRRKALALMGAAGAAALGGCNISTGLTGGTPTVIDGCILTPEQTEGPYFVDEMLNRSDIRSDPTNGSVQQGVPLRLKLNVSQIVNNACGPLAGAIVDIWHCDSQGLYSDESANGTLGRKYLRGFQTTNANGEVELTTIYPGWYSGRTVHIHFKVRSGSLEFNSQLYFDETVTASVYANAPYSSRGLPNTSNARDGIFNSNTLLTLTPDGDGFSTTFNVAVRTA